MLERIILTGYMGAGKSTVGRLLAAELGWRFVDSDDTIVAMAGRSIPELFAEGEATFRHWEQQAIASLAHDKQLVLATGGGAVTRDDTRGLLEAMGPIVVLKADAATLWSRAGADPGRPLAAEQAAFAARLAERAALYDQFPLSFDTTTRTPAEVAAEIRSCLFAQAGQVQVALGERAYTIHVAPGGLSALAALLEGTPGPCLVVTDDGVPAVYPETVMHALHYGGWRPELVTVPAGEASKSLAQAERLYDACIRAGLRRHHPVIALGGGVVGDLAGFVAATYQRGVPFVQIPTTLLAQIDSSVGGKVAVNHPRGKNLIGAFYQPRLVLADTATLLTLSEREYRAGIGELLKYGVILDAELFDLMEREVAAIARRDLPLLSELVSRCCALKARVVIADEREAPGGPRAWLNFGHTLGHAIEAVAGYGTVLHGEAVAMGMVAASRLAVERGLWSAHNASRLEALVASLGLAPRPPALDAEELMAAMGRDKKNQDRGITFILPSAMGTVSAVEIEPRELAGWLGRVLNERR